jgi:hypothetical protein
MTDDDNGRVDPPLGKITTKYVDADGNIWTDEEIQEELMKDYPFACMKCNLTKELPDFPTSLRSTKYPEG